MQSLIDHMLSRVKGKNVVTELKIIQHHRDHYGKSCHLPKTTHRKHSGTHTISGCTGQAGVNTCRRVVVVIVVAVRSRPCVCTIRSSCWRRPRRKISGPPFHLSRARPTHFIRLLLGVSWQPSPLFLALLAREHAQYKPNTYPARY